MLMYRTSDKITADIKAGKVVVKQYYFTKQGNLVFILEDKAIQDDKRYIKVMFSKGEYSVSNELFEIQGSRVSVLSIERYVKFFSSSYFLGALLQLVNPIKPNETITISIQPKSSESEAEKK